MQGVLTSLSPLAARTNNESTAASPTAGMASGSITVPSRKGAEHVRPVGILSCPGTGSPSCPVVAG